MLWCQSFEPQATRSWQIPCWFWISIGFRFGGQDSKVGTHHQAKWEESWYLRWRWPCQECEVIPACGMHHLWAFTRPACWSAWREMCRARWGMIRGCRGSRFLAAFSDSILWVLCFSLYSDRWKITCVWWRMLHASTPHLHGQMQLISDGNPNLSKVCKSEKTHTRTLSAHPPTPGHV